MRIPIPMSRAGVATSAVLVFVAGAALQLKASRDQRAQAQEAAPTLLAARAVGAPAQVLAAPTSVPEAALDAAPILDTPVSFEALRRPLPQMLQEMGEKAKVELSAGAPELARARVTARGDGLPLRQAMRSLARLYGAHWARLGQARYELRPSGFSPFETELLRMGNPDFQMDGNEGILRPQRRSLALRLARYLPPEGGPLMVRDLPEAERRDLKRAFARANAVRVIQEQLKGLPASIDTCIVHANRSGKDDEQPAVIIGLLAPDVRNREGHTVRGSNLLWIGAVALDELYKVRS